LPAAVDAAFRRAHPDARIKRVTHETENGQEQYEIESVDRDRESATTHKRTFMSTSLHDDAHGCDDGEEGAVL